MNGQGLQLHRRGQLAQVGDRQQVLHRQLLQRFVPGEGIVIVCGKPRQFARGADEISGDRRGKAAIDRQRRARRKFAERDTLGRAGHGKERVGAACGRKCAETLPRNAIERALHAQLASQAITDPLTGLLNRRGFNQALESLLARVVRSGKRIAVLYLDLDGFKRINDSLGHAAGDQVLQYVAEQLRVCLRPYDILARVGGDEFTILLDSLVHPEYAAKIAEKLIQMISVRHRVDGVEVTLGASVGIASFPECGQDLEGLLRAADMAMYEAKRAGRQQYRFFSPEMNGRARSRLMLEESLRTAIEQHDFQLVYQPQIHLQTGRLRGQQAVARILERQARAGRQAHRAEPGKCNRVHEASLSKQRPLRLQGPRRVSRG